jgi:Tfp pilus assembly protein PilO
MSLENVNISSSGNAGSGSAADAVTTVGASSGPYDSLDVEFTVHGTYAQFIQYVTSLESSLRIVDLVKLSVTGGGSGGSSASVYTFDVTLRTYWLK